MSNSNGYKSNESYAKRDVYRQTNAYRTSDPYRNNDAYRTHNPYEDKDPYEDQRTKDTRERSKPCSFWFECKLKMQDIFSTDSGAQAEKRVFNTDTDPFILTFFVKMSTMGLKSLFLVPLVMTIFFIASIYATPEILLIIAMAEFLYIAYILYCPAWQTYTAGQYAISSTGEEFYSKWKKGYLGYEGTTITSFVVSVLGISLLAKYPYPFVYVYNYFGLDIPKTEQFISAVLFVVISSMIFLIFYFVLTHILKKKDAENKKINKRLNIDMRTKSIVGQLGAMLDSYD